MTLTFNACKPFADVMVDPERRQQAKRICAGCPEVNECETWARSGDASGILGVVGGLAENERPMAVCWKCGWEQPGETVESARHLCGGAARNKPDRTRTGDLFDCLSCGIEFRLPHGLVRYCSDGCKKTGGRRRARESWERSQLQEAL